MSAASVLDVLGPHRGPCGLCGGPDARHRVADTIAECVAAGDSAEAMAEDFGITVNAVRAIAAATEMERLGVEDTTC